MSQIVFLLSFSKLIINFFTVLFFLKKPNTLIKKSEILFLGNGPDPKITTEWVLSSYKKLIRTDRRKFDRRIAQLKWINKSLTLKYGTWFYFDIVEMRQLYLNGRNRDVRADFN